MTSFTYNDQVFSLAANGSTWDLSRGETGEPPALVGTGLFEGADASQAMQQAQALVRAIYPVGIKLVGPDVAHPMLVGELKIVGPNVAHPNFIHWDKDSSAFPPA